MPKVCPLMLLWTCTNVCILQMIGKSIPLISLISVVVKDNEAEEEGRENNKEEDTEWRRLWKLVSF